MWWLAIKKTERGFDSFDWKLRNSLCINVRIFCFCFNVFWEVTKCQLLLKLFTSSWLKIEAMEFVFFLLHQHFFDRWKDSDCFIFQVFFINQKKKLEKFGKLWIYIVGIWEKFEKIYVWFFFFFLFPLPSFLRNYSLYKALWTYLNNF